MVAFNDNTKGNIVNFIILFLSILLVPNVGVACSTDADCNNLEQYCDTNYTVPIIGHPCSTCDKPTDASFNTSGERNGTGSRSCPWKCPQGYFYHEDSYKCVPCLYGSVSDGTDAGNDCYWQSTTIHDKNGSFTLTAPASNSHIYLSDALHDKMAQSAQQ